MGIACSCNGEYVELGVDQFSRERELICYIAVARDVVTKDIRERIPGYQEFYPYNEDPSWTCAEECTQVNHEKVPQYNGQRLITEFCHHNYIDEKHICRESDNILNGCTEAYYGICVDCGNDPPTETG